MGQQTVQAPVMSVREMQKNLGKIIDWVDEYRLQHNVRSIGREQLPELSCTLVGEGYNLLIRQLVNTEYPYGCWSELTNDTTGEIIQLVLDEMPKH